MKILFISDIHGISTNLDMVKKVYEHGVSKLVVLGDLYYAGFNSFDKKSYDNEKVKDFLMQFRDNLICMRGNCDSDLDVTGSDFPINEGISVINVDGIDKYLTHGNKYNSDNHNKYKRKGVLVYGHYHVPSIKKIDDMVYINVGSISLPRSGGKASYGIYENRCITLYDIDGNIIDKTLV